MDRYCYMVEISQMYREELEDLFQFALGMLSKCPGYMQMTTQEVYDCVVKQFNEQIGGGDDRLAS